MSIEAEEYSDEVSDHSDEEGRDPDCGGVRVHDEELEGEDGSEADGSSVPSGEWAGPYNATEVNDAVFEELALPLVLVGDCQRVWQSFLSGADSIEAAGEAIYAALFDSAPSLQGLFKTPRAVMSMRFMNGLNTIVQNLGKPTDLKTHTEMLGFQHLDLEVTVPRVAVFRGAIIELIGAETGTQFTPQVQAGLCTMLNYVGGSFIYIRTKFAERLTVIASSWSSANKKVGLESEGAGEQDESGERIQIDAPEAKEAAKSGRTRKRSSLGKPSSLGKGLVVHSGSAEILRKTDFKNTSVPQTFDAMFSFNMAVMGMGGHAWLSEVLSSFDAIVSNVANSYRLQEECDVLSLRLAKHKGTIDLNEFKSVMLASMRSLCKDWGSNHEVAWSWLWSNVERLLQSNMGKPRKQEQALAKFLGGLDDSATQVIRREVYVKFFALAPAGQDYFKQSSTRLHFIVDKLLAMTQEMYRNPKKMVNDISALGLRHVGYGIPTDLFDPFVTACVEVVRHMTNEPAAEEAFRWSLGLISRILVRVIGEGSTIVMRAINANSAKMLKRAVDCAPRGDRALWVLNVQVGTQSISPLMLAIQSGSLEAGEAILVDLLTIRADRDRYYYGLDMLYQRHEDIVRRLCIDAPPLLKTFLDGMVWRSRTTENGLRRVNYYVKHLIVTGDGGFARTTEWITDISDPMVVCHPVVSLVLDTVWKGVVKRRFLMSKAWFLLTLVVFVLAQCVLVQTTIHDNVQASDQSVVAVTVLRSFMYTFSMGGLVWHHVRNIFSCWKTGDVMKLKGVPVPAYLDSWQESFGLLLTVTLVMMLCTEPLLHCSTSDTVGSLEVRCEATESGLLKFYSILSCLGTITYFLLLTDLSVLSTKVSAFTLICRRISSELFLSVGALIFVSVTFGCAACALDQSDPNFDGVPSSFFQFVKITLNTFSSEHFDALERSPILWILACAYIIICTVFILNVLIAQFVCAHQQTFSDMVGYAMLCRGAIVTEIMPQVSKDRWGAFVGSLRMDLPIEFGEGDIGLSGGIQVVEPANANITTHDSIRRYGGTTRRSAPWPQDEGGGDEVDKFDRLEKVIEKAMKKISKVARGKNGSSFASSNSLSTSSASGGHSTGSK